jgi:RNA polymerase sigma factor (sigma-70 family)
MANAEPGIVLRHLRRLVDAGAETAETDAELLARFVARQEEPAFADLVKRHGAMIFQVCRRIHGNQHDAEDVFQATFLLLARKAGSIRKQDSVANWLHGVAHRLALQARGQANRRQARERRAADMRRISNTSNKAWHDLQATLDEALRQVPAKYRTPLLLCYLESKTQEEAARQLGCPLGTLRSRLARGKNRLKEVLSRQGICLTTSALAAGLAISGDAVAGIPATLVHKTTRAGLDYAAGKVVDRVVSARVLALVETALHGMAAANFKMTIAAVLVVGAFGFGAGTLATRVLAVAPNHADKSPAPSSSAEPSKPGPSQPQAPDRSRQNDMAIRGRVLDSGGKPVPAAKLLVPRPGKTEPDNEKDLVIEPAGTTDADGQFNVNIAQLPSPLRTYLIAQAPGLGVDWIELGPDRPPDDVTLRLPKDVPIVGRVVNTEGNPVAGVSVEPTAILVPADEDLGAYLRGWSGMLHDALATPKKRLYVPLGIGGATTDGDGRFAIHGCGAERIVEVTFFGGSIARTMPYVITRPGFNPKPYNDELLKEQNSTLRVLNRFPGLYPPSLTFVAEAGKTVEGVIGDAVTGKPVPGCRLYAHAGYGDVIRVLCDADGKYVLRGLAKNAGGYHLSVTPPSGAGYLNRTTQAPDTAGYAPVRLDIALAKGTTVSGRVVEKQTGKGVHAGIRFAPLPGNRFFGSKTGFDNYHFDRTTTATDKAGRFRLVTVPGKALVLAQVHEREKWNGERLCPYRRAVPDPDHKELFKYDPDIDSWLTTSVDNSLEFLNIENACKVIDIKENGETTVELFIDRGTTGRVTVQDLDGKPLAGTWIAGVTDHWPLTYKAPESTHTIFALDPSKPRMLALFHPDRKLAGTVTIRGDEKEPVVAKLGPLGTIKGRFLDADGNPSAGAEVSINARLEIPRELYRFAKPGRPVITDNDGRFALDNVVPGITFFLQIQKGQKYFGGKPKIGMRLLSAGGTVDLGDRIIEPLQ